MRALIIAVVCVAISQAQVLAIDEQSGSSGAGTRAVSSPTFSASSLEIDLLKMQLKQVQKINVDLNSMIRTYQDEASRLTQIITTQLYAVASYEAQIQTLTATNDQSSNDLQTCNNETSLLQDQLVEANDLTSNLTHQISQVEGQRDTCRKTLEQVVVQRDDLSRSKIACLANLSGCITALDNCTSEHQDVRKIHAAVSDQLRNCSLENLQLGEITANLTGDLSSTEYELSECLRNASQCSLEKDQCLRTADLCKTDKDDCNNELADKVNDLGSLGQEMAQCNSTLVLKMIELDDKERDLIQCQKGKSECDSNLVKSQDEIAKIQHQSQMKAGKASCQQWQALNVPSGVYEINPDGENKGVAPFNVMCDFSKSPIETRLARAPMQLETEIKGSSKNRCSDASNFGLPHPSMRSNSASKSSKGNNSGDKDDDKYKRSKENSSNDESKICAHNNLNYGADHEQLAALTAMSTSCEQIVSWTCVNQDKLVLFTNSGAKERKIYKSELLWWMWARGHNKSSQSEWKNFFLDFSESSGTQCDCAGKCTADSRLACNCYADKNTQFTDTITLTNKDDLPVMRVGLGDLQSSHERGSVSVGDLVCV